MKALKIESSRVNLSQFSFSRYDSDINRYDNVLGFPVVPEDNLVIMNIGVISDVSIYNEQIELIENALAKDLKDVKIPSFIKSVSVEPNYYGSVFLGWELTNANTENVRKLQKWYSEFLDSEPTELFEFACYMHMINDGYEITSKDDFFGLLSATKACGYCLEDASDYAENYDIPVKKIEAWMKQYEKLQK